MPGKKPVKKKRTSTAAKAESAPPAAAPARLPAPERVPKERVGEVVQDFIEFGGARAVMSREESGGTWLVTATA